VTAKQRIDKLSRLLRKRIPRIAITVDAPSTPRGDWFVDTTVGKQSFVIELRPSLGFGLSSTPADGIGEGPEELFDDEAAVVQRVAELVRRKGRTAPQRVRLLQELRQRMQISQVAVAERLKVRQPTISKIERREDMNLSTLRRYVRALGGELHVTARFPDITVEIGVESRSRKHARSGRS
jgi:DNA-binding XRE family transcriptional regulator